MERIPMVADRKPVGLADGPAVRTKPPTDAIPTAGKERTLVVVVVLLLITGISPTESLLLYKPVKKTENNRDKGPSFK